MKPADIAPLTGISLFSIVQDEEEQQRYLNGSATEPRSLLLGPLRTYLGEDSHRARDMGKWGWRVDASRWSLQLLLLLASSLTLATDLPGE